MALSQTHFQNAHDFTVKGSQFFNIHANGVAISNASGNDPVSTTLWQNVAAGAIFDSAERFPPAKCHPGTRERMIERIADWIDNPTPNHRILWLYGPAGNGKSALAHAICERYKDRCRCSFFFARGFTDRGKGLKLFTTLSYQLALQFPSMRAVLNEALYHDPSLPTKSMETQLFSLIIQPLLRCTPLSEHSPILIIDGLDECADDQGMDTQSSIITLISKAIVEYNIPLRFLIASRPESWIRDTFGSLPLPSITLSLSLRDDIDADKDIKAYLTDGFEKIRVENMRIMGSVTPPWPPTHIVERFVYEASRQYIYPSIVLKIVGNSSKHSDPEEQLRILISPGPHRVLAFSELDRLYVTIVSAYPRWTTMKRVLGGILVGANSTIIEKILGVEPREFILVMDALSPLIGIEVPGPLSHYEQSLESIYGSLTTGQEKFKLSHLSFREFLEDESRSGAFHVDIHEIVKEIGTAFFGIIVRNIDQNYATEPHVLLNIGLATYMHMMSVMIFDCMRSLDIDTWRQLIISMTQSLLLLGHSPEMEYSGFFMAEMDLFSPIISGSWNWFVGILRPQTRQYLEHERHELIHAVSALRDATSLARGRCIHQFSSYKRFKVTPTLAYLHEFHTLHAARIDTIFENVLRFADVLPALQQHRHIIQIYYNHAHQTWYIGSINLNEDLVDDRGVDGGWRTLGEWRHERISIISQKLSILLNNDSDEENWLLVPPLARFFISRNLSDIDSGKYFQNPCNLSILAVMTNFSAWTNLSTLGKEGLLELEDFIVQILCWSNRQLTNSTTLRLLEDLDKNLLPKMRSTMNQIFQHFFLPNYISSCHHELCCSIQGIRDFSIKMTVLPLPQGYYQEQVPYIDHEYPPSWHAFHDEIFGKPLATTEEPLINHQQWHPYLASYLLNYLAKDLYMHIHSTTLDRDLDDDYFELTSESFAYIVECLPYAETTQQNLDSLRAIAYLFPHADLEWYPPIEFWSLSVDFLKKYDRSILSEDELNWFEWWMYSMRRYMTRYHPAT